jgi:tetratricopeptide (TPR) repeat protein
MVSYLLGTDNLDRNLEKLILEKTEGVPFFIEEFIRSLIDLEIIEKKNNQYHLAKDIQEIVIPSTVQDVIMSRVDSLPEGTKLLLQAGSVIEREFSYELIRLVTGLQKPELLSHFSMLKDTELLYERGIYPNATYIFQHALIRETVYDSILIRRRKKLHEQVGNAIEKLYKDNLEEYYGVLAEHYILSENYDKSYKFSMLAAEKAEKKAALNDAISYTEKRVLSAEKLPQNNDRKAKVIESRIALGLYLLQALYYVEAKTVIDPISDTVFNSANKTRITQILSIIGTYEYSIEEDYTKALEHLQEAINISEEIKDFLSIFHASFRLGIALGWCCEFQRSISCFEKALQINLAKNNLWGVSVIKSAISIFVYNRKGRINQGYQTSKEAVQIAEECGDIFPKAWAYVSHGYSNYYKGFFGEAIENLQKGAHYCETIDFPIWDAAAALGLGEIFFERGEYEDSMTQCERGIQRLQSIRSYPSWMNLHKAALIRAKVMYNKEDIDLKLLYDYAHTFKIKAFQSWILRCIGEILLRVDEKHTPEAEKWITKAIETDEKYGMKWYLAQDYALYTDLFKKKDDLPRAKAHLSKAIEIFKECGADGWVEKYGKELAAL